MSRDCGQLRGRHKQAESSRDTVQRRKNSCHRDAFVFFLWHTSIHQPIAMVSGRCRYILLIAGPKHTLAASHAAHGESRWVCRRDRRTDGRTPELYVTFSVMDAAARKIWTTTNCYYCVSVLYPSFETNWFLRVDSLLQKLTTGTDTNLNQLTVTFRSEEPISTNAWFHVQPPCVGQT